MKLRLSKVISAVLSLCTVFSVCVLGTTTNAHVDAAGFEAFNSYLTYDEYRSLNLNVGSAQSCDGDFNAKPVDTEKNKDIRLADVKYGWSNPQVLAVMASAPYWSELSYGSGLASAGNTSFTVSTDETNSNSESMNIKLGVSVTAAVNTEVFGNGATLGASLSQTLSYAEAVQRSKTKGTSHTFTAGAGDDYVALMAIPVAAYKYEYTHNGKTEAFVVNIQLDPVYSLATLKNYNTVAKSHNEKEKDCERMMPVINLDSFAPDYIPGDPSTYPSDISQINQSFNLVYGDMLVDKGCEMTHSEVGENQIRGKVYSCKEFYAVGLGTASFGQSVKFSESQGNSMEQGVVLGASVFEEVSAGVDLGVGKSTVKARAEVSASIGATVSYTTVNTKGVTYTMTFANLPDSAVTGVTSQGIDTTSYSFNTKLAVWVPEEKGEGVWSAPSVIMPLVSFPEDASLPPFIPKDLHALKVSDTAVTLGWDVTAHRCKRPADFYKLMISTKGSENSYTLHSTIDGSCFQYEVKDLTPDTTYSFALKAVSADGTESVTGASVTVTTKSDKSPVILSQPQNVRVDEGDKAEFTVIPQGDIDGYSYQWYRMSEDRYGTSWKLINGADKNTFNAAYFAEGGKVNGINRADLDGSVYRCLITDKKSGINVASDSATLYISDTCLIDSYTELKEIATKIAVGEVEYAYKDYNLGCDITVPQGEVWTVPFGTKEHLYHGDFDGKGYTIYDFTFDNSDAPVAGFFGCTEYASIKNLNLFNSHITGGENTGGIVGKATNTIIENCNTVAYIKGSAYTGGIAGYGNVNSFIEGCYVRTALQTLNPQGYTGGIAGYNYGCTIENSVAEAYIHADGEKGGVAGLNFGVIRNTFYNINYFDGEAVGKAVDPVGENVKGLTDSELKTIFTRPM